MPIVSTTQKQKEKNQAQEAEQKEIEKTRKRKKNAKKFACLSLLGFSLSVLVYQLVGSGPGLFLAIVSSTIPSITNLLDD